MSIPCVFSSSVSKGRWLNLYIIGVIVARIWADYYMFNFIDYLTRQDPLRKVAPFTPALASAIINAKDALSGICGIIGAILIDVLLTNYGLIFISSLIYGLAFVVVFFVSGVFGLFVSATANLSLMNSSNNLVKEERHQRKENKFLHKHHTLWFWG